MQGWIYYAFQARIPIILCGVIAYLNKNDLDYLIKLFAAAMLATLVTQENMMIHSMMIPLFFTALSVVKLNKMFLFKELDYIGRHSLEIFLAQTITTQYVMTNYFWVNHWVSLSIVLTMTLALSVIFGLWQQLYDKLRNVLLVGK